MRMIAKITLIATIKKTSIMNQLSSYLKRGVLILVASMLIIIPNLDVCSSIGNYQAVSSAIKANDRYAHHNSSNDRLLWFPAAVIGGVIGIVGVVVSVVVVTAAVEYHQMGSKTIPSSLNRFRVHYAKHDFSQFDN